MTQWRWQRGFPAFGTIKSYSRVKFGEPLQAEGNLSYLEFIAAVKALWEESYPMYPIKPTATSDNAFTWYNKDAADPITGEVVGAWENTDAIITYGLELRKSHTVEPKPRMRYSYPKDKIMIYGQRFQNVVSFSAISPIGKRFDGDSANINNDHDNAYVVESLIESFEDFMLEYTPIFKRIGAAELVYARRLSDSEVGRQASDVHKRTVTYMLTTEKLYGADIDTIERIAVDVRTYMAVEESLLQQSTPNYENVELNIIDLDQSATPNL